MPDKDKSSRDSSRLRKELKKILEESLKKKRLLYGTMGYIRKNKNAESSE